MPTTLALWPSRSAFLWFGLMAVLNALAGTPAKAAAASADAQDPTGKSQKPVTEEIRFRHGDHVLAATLYRAPGPGRHPAIALVLGSGPVDRAYGGAGVALGEHFAAAGIVCLTWDRPGIGHSTGDCNAQTFRDRADEALAAVRFLRGRSDVYPDRVGLWGHSQGGMVVPLAASLSDDIAFVIEVSGWQGPAWRQDAARVEAELKADAFSEAVIQTATAFARKRMDLIRGTGPFEELDRAQKAIEMFPWFEYIHRCDSARFYAGRRMVSYDSGPSWENVRCPVLVIYGDKDTSSGPPDGLVEIIRRGLTKAGNQDVTIKIFHNADHSLCKSETGGRKEAAKRAKTRKKEGRPDFVPGYLDTMTTWLVQRFGRVP
jgi:uncharacterized protein